MCGQTAFPVTDYECPVHGVYKVDVRFADGTGRFQVLILFEKILRMNM